MSSKDRVELFLKYQNENMPFEEISKKLEVKPDTLRRTLNKHGYKSDKGIYVKKIDESQISFDGINNNESIKAKVKGKSNKTKGESKTKETVKVKEVKKKKDEQKTKKLVKVKKDKKINVTQEDMDKLCELYDWYIEVKDCKALKPKKTSNKKDIVLDNENIKDVKSVNIRVEKETWEDFERLCSNSSFNKKEIITQALKDFMKTYKNLL